MNLHCNYKLSSLTRSTQSLDHLQTIVELLSWCNTIPSDICEWFGPVPGRKQFVYIPTLFPQESCKCKRVCLHWFDAQRLKVLVFHQYVHVTSYFTQHPILCYSKTLHWIVCISTYPVYAIFRTYYNLCIIWNFAASKLSVKTALSALVEHSITKDACSLFMYLCKQVAQCFHAHLWQELSTVPVFSGICPCSMFWAWYSQK